ncbi:MAG: DUF4402 domain-containing protein [Clostridia bacterium]|nr:DUF4402 domain-containing protein [Clostridia bacterium]
MHRNLVILFIVVFLGAAHPGSSQTSITGQAFAEVIEALTANETNQLNFGKFSTDDVGGNIMVSPDGTMSVQGAVITVPGPVSPGKFQITGAPEASFTMQLPAGPAVLIHEGSSKTMLVEDWVADPPLENGPAVLSNGQRVVSIGATLSVGSYDENPIGIYSGTFQLTFAYN